MNKITVIGFTGSGKTTYLVGAYNFMSMGAGSIDYSLVSLNGNDNAFFLQTWNQISSGDNRVWPSTTPNPRKYSFALQRNLMPIRNSEFEWMDYPGSALVQANSPDLPKIQQSIDESSCLLLIVSGRSFAFTKKNGKEVPVEASDSDACKGIVASNLANNKDILAINTLSHMAQRGIKIPPVAIVVTMRDLIDSVWRNSIGEIIYENFRLLFNSGVPVFVTSVTLGEEIARGGNASPEGVEKPLAYALLSMFGKRIKDSRKRISDNKSSLEAKNTFFNRLFSAATLDSLKGKIRDDEQEIEYLSDNARDMLKFFDNDSIFYVNGEKTKLIEYFSDIIPS